MYIYRMGMAHTNTSKVAQAWPVPKHPSPHRHGLYQNV